MTRETRGKAHKIISNSTNHFWTFYWATELHSNKVKRLSWGKTLSWILVFKLDGSQKPAENVVRDCWWGEAGEERLIRGVGSTHWEPPTGHPPASLSARQAGFLHKTEQTLGNPTTCIFCNGFKTLVVIHTKYQNEEEKNDVCPHNARSKGTLQICMYAVHSSGLGTHCSVNFALHLRRFSISCLLPRFDCLIHCLRRRQAPSVGY